MRQHHLLPLLVIILSVSSALTASETSINGNIHVYSAGSPSNGDFYRNALITNLEVRRSFNQTSLLVDLGAGYDSVRSSSAVRELYTPTPNVDYIDNQIDNEKTRVYLRQAFINQEFHVTGSPLIDSITLKIGKIITRWGHSAYFSSVDVINPQDYSFHVMKPVAERKKGVYACTPALYFSQYFFIEGYINPVFEPHDEFSGTYNTANSSKFLSYGEMGAEYTGERKPKPSIYKTAFAGRAGLQFTPFTAHVMYYNGYNHSPVYELSGPFATPTVEATYHRYEMVGIDFMSNLLWDINFKGEAAYSNKGKKYYISEDSLEDDLDDGGNGTVEARDLDYTAGFEVVKEYGKSLFMWNMEFNQHIVFDLSSDIEADRLNYKFLNEIKYAFLDKKVYIQNTTIYGYTDNDIGAQFELGLKPESNYKIKCGYWLFREMDDKGFMGQYKDSEFLYFGGDLSF